jgi:23S rRNA (pseudouridine1915-N3)-methyltransferase
MLKLSVASVGRPRGPIADAIREYEKRLGRYFAYDAFEVRETPFRGQPIAQLLDDEGDRLLARVPKQNELVALHRPGRAWSSEDLARYLEGAGVRSVPGVTFVIGGAYGLASALLDRAQQHFSLSAMTLPHDLARLVLTEQLYRAGTIARGEPYHKTPQN